ncbi:bifunctional adenosylcobinamide kinase/adenosylcobinamide-phosphate guanylyltransferase [Cytobacillus sp. FJAT-54145]|uniref:Adenosylcobinamide kinase n=1 Tax=Cytobacillus spartinae TaxID=3299023 RepID=A0ABW6KGX4_9BACI
METAELIFVSGGVRSGKSSFGERLAIEKAEKIGGALHYIATGSNSDAEMKERIMKHQQDRMESHANWKTWEKETSVHELASCFKQGDVLLLDCLTTLLNNEFFSGEYESQERKIYERICKGIEHLSESCSTLIVVSNEVLNEPLLDNTLVYTYCRLIGHLHQRLVEKATEAYLVEAGIPKQMKKGG